MNSFHVIERILPIRMSYACIFHGVDDVTRPDHIKALLMLSEAIDDELMKLPKEGRESANKRSHKVANMLLQPFIDEKMKAGKFLLILYYAMHELMDRGVFETDNARFEEIFEVILKEGGTVADMANVNGIDRSAQKRAKQLIASMNSLGYFNREEVA